MRAPVAAAASASVAPSSNLPPLELLNQLRQHPQFNHLKSIIQSNPAALPQILAVLGQQSPELLKAITSNEQAFLDMMNEPITNDPPPAPAANPAGAPPGIGAGGPNPQQVTQLLAALPPAQRNAFAAQLGLRPEEMQAFMQLMHSMPPEQLSQLMAQGGAGGGHGHGHGDATVVTLTEDELASVNRLAGLGFSQQRAAEAYLACDRNEELAAHFLFESGDMDGGGGGGFDFDDHDDDMYN